MYWTTCLSGGTSQIFPTLTTERMLWLQANHSIDKVDSQTFAIQLTESLYPWLNNKLYHEIETIKKNKHTNDAYEEQRATLERIARQTLQ